MAEIELRHFYSDDYIEEFASILSSQTKIDKSDIVSFILRDGWDELALKQRMARLTESLVEFLPNDFDEAIVILKYLLKEICTNKRKYYDMLAMFVPDYVLYKGIDKMDLSLDALLYFTHNGTSSEFAIRPFILQDAKYVMSKMLEYSKHPDECARRFASEGCRPRLPWAMALPEFKKDPSLILPILENLKADNSKFVQKSVANNLNDISKDNPEIVVNIAKRWLGDNPNTNWIVKHACRTLLKQANPEILELFGSSAIELSECKLGLRNHNIIFGSELEFDFKGQIKGGLPSNLRIEYGIDFLKSNGSYSRKIFKIKEVKGDSRNISFTRSHKFLDYSTRRHYPGTHKVSVILNGLIVAQEEFELIMDDAL